MRKTIKKTWMLLLMLALLAATVPFAAAENTAETADEWTILFYLCGTDLESKYSYGSGNLEEMTKVFAVPGKETKVNVLLETGGCSEWHTENIGLEISPYAIQRWRMNTGTMDPASGRAPSSFELLDTLPLRSMADPETLADFIRWGLETCPARKTALVLWDHGAGSGSGLLMDELYENDVLKLYELKQALSDSGAQLEAIVIDACAMASLETVLNVKDCAKWLAASEEVVPGKGAALQEWLQEVIFHPECDGKQLCRTLADLTLADFANDDSRQAQRLLTWSVIDLSAADRLEKAANRFFKTLYETYRDRPAEMSGFARTIQEAEEYGDGKQAMLDYAGIFYNPDFPLQTETDLRNENVEAVSEAVVYSIRGTGRPGARGLSFCYPVRFGPEELDIYAKNYPNPWWLALLDALSDWTAPDEVYEAVERLPEIGEVEALRLEITKSRTGDGMPAIRISNLFNHADEVYIRMYQLNEGTGQIRKLGRVSCSGDYEKDPAGGNDSILWYPVNPMQWIGIEGQPCCIDQLEIQADTEGVGTLYNILIQIGRKISNLRCGQVFAGGAVSWEAYGIWEGYDDNSRTLNRNVRELTQVAGQEYELLYPVDEKGTGERTMYESGPTMTMYRKISLETILLPAGTYYLEYEIDDMFTRPFVLDRIEFRWDGEKITFPDELVWEGTEIMGFFPLSGRGSGRHIPGRLWRQCAQRNQSRRCPSGCPPAPDPPARPSARRDSTVPPRLRSAGSGSAGPDPQNNHTSSERACPFQPFS